MYKKGVVVLVLLLSIGFALAQSNSSNNSIPSSTSSSDTISQAYQCLQTQINNKAQNAISLQEAVFGVLALGANSKLTAVIDSKATGGNHWSESSSQIKDTAQALLAYDRINRNTESIESWLLSNRRTATELTWYLELDITNHVPAQCTISYSAEQRTINVNEDMTLSGNPGSCLTISQGGFWLKVSNTCIDQNFTVSCDEDFVTTTLYQRAGSSTIFVSPVAHSAAALGTTQESINSKCLSTSTNSCDYEGTLWAALALDSTNNDVSDYLPYLLALAESNQKFIPSGFLHALTQGQDQYSQLVQQQQQSKYWQAPNTPYNRYYDSALAMLALKGSSAAELTNAKTYFESITTPEGCWNNNNIRDTAFLLYAGWPRSVPTSGGTGSGSGSSSCTGHGYCTSVFVCDSIGGSVFEQYDCSSGVCCSQEPAQQSCSAQNGQLCTASQVCSGTTTQSSDGSCCLGSCTAAPAASACESAGGSCYTSCTDNEEQIPESCSDSTVCCKPKEDSGSSSNLWLWVIILAILVVLVIVGILMRNKIKLAMFKRRGQPSSPVRGFPPGGRPPFPPSRGAVPPGRAPPRYIQQPSSTPVRKGVSSADADMEETMRKLRDMSK